MTTNHKQAVPHKHCVHPHHTEWTNILQYLGGLEASVTQESTDLGSQQET